MTSSYAPSQNTTTILLCATCVLCIVIITPTLIYCTFRFNQHKETVVVRKRYPKIIMMIVTLLIMNIAIRVPLTVLVITPSTLPVLKSLHHSDIALLIESFLHAYMTHAAVTLIALRFWMTFYKINYTYCSSTSAWKTVINPLISTNNWFLKPSHKSTFGNAKYMFCRYFLPFYVIYATLDFFLLINNRWSVFFALNLSIYQFISGLYYLLVMIFCVYLYKQTPNWNDDCYIRSEMRLGSLTWFICLIAYIIECGIFLVFAINEYIHIMIATSISLILFTVYGLVLTLYPIATNKAAIDLNKQHSLYSDIDLNFVLSDVLSDALLFDHFMNYLSRSFSTESLLSFVEFYHFKQFIILQFQTQLLNDENKMFIERLKDKMQSKRHKNTKTLRSKNQDHSVAQSIVISSNLWNIMLPDSVPKSCLVFGDFMVKHLSNGKSIKKSMGKLEKSASKFGIKLHEAEKQRKSQQTNTNESNLTKIGANATEISEISDQEKSKSDRYKSNKKLSKKTRFSNIRKESATVHSATDGSFNGVRLRIPDGQLQYNREMDLIQTSMESVTEKDVYNYDENEIKIGTPSIVSQSTPHVAMDPDITSIDDIDESRTTTYQDPKLFTGGVSVEVDEHLHKNREISVTPQPSQTSMVTFTKKYKDSYNNRRTASITPYGSTRQRFGSNTTTATATVTSQLSVTMDTDEKEMLPLYKQESSADTSNTPSLLLKGIAFGDMPLDMDEAIAKIRLIAHKLYMKYIHIGSEWEINIPHRIRKKLIQLKMHNVDEWLQETKANINELYHLFDDCMEEMFALMRSNISVFVESQNYQNIVDK